MAGPEIHAREWWSWWRAEGQEAMTRLLRDQWNPIGDVPADEYAGYATRLGGLLREGVAENELTTFLSDARVGAMGLPADPESTGARRRRHDPGTCSRARTSRASGPLDRERSSIGLGHGLTPERASINRCAPDSANFNVIQGQPQNNQVSQTAGIQFNLLSKKGWFFQNDLNNQTYTYKGTTPDQNFWLWNISVGKKFLKDQKGELKLSVFDLLKQNKSITRTVTEVYVEDVQSQVLRQYFMLTLSYKLKNFGNAKPNNPLNNNFRRNF